MLDNRINFYIESISIFTKIALSANYEDKNICLKAIAFFIKRLRFKQNCQYEDKLELNKLELNKIEINENEIVLIADYKSQERKFIEEFLKRYSSNYYIFSSVEEYKDIREELEEDRIILFQEKFMNRLNSLYLFAQNDIALAINNENNELKFISTQTNERVDFFGSITENKEIKLDKYEYLNVLLLSNDLEYLKFLTDILSLMGIEFNIIQDIDKVSYIVQKKSYNLVLIDYLFCETNIEELLSIIHKNLSSNTIKVVYNLKSEMKREISINEKYSCYLEFWEIQNLFHENFSIYKLEDSENKKTINEYDSYFKTFYSHFVNKINELECDLENKNWDKISKTAHNLKSGAGVLKEKYLLSLLHDIDDSASKKNLDLLEKNINQLKKEKSKFKNITKIQL